MMEWKKAVRTPLSYTINNNAIKIQKTFMTVIPICGAIALFTIYTLIPRFNIKLTKYNHIDDPDPDHVHIISKATCKPSEKYNNTYPLSLPKISNSKLIFRIAVVSDLDTNSKIEVGWISYLLKGYLIYDKVEQSVKIRWDKRKIELKSRISAAGRGMELSELIVFNGKLYTCDDRTGIIYEIYNNSVIPWVILNDGNGKSTKAFKCEWFAVKDEKLYVGGLGKEWTDSQGNLVNHDPQWIKKVSPNGVIENVNWINEYVALRSSVGIHYPGYVIHESAAWSKLSNKWYFIPRRASPSSYNEVEDERMGTNLLITGNEDFSDISIKTVGSVIPTHGYSSFKFIPDTGDTKIIAIKSEEDNGNIASYITAFTSDGKVLLPEERIGKESIKYEGIEFV